MHELTAIFDDEVGGSASVGYRAVDRHDVARFHRESVTADDGKRIDFSGDVQVTVCNDDDISTKAGNPVAGIVPIGIVSSDEEIALLLVCEASPTAKGGSIGNIKWSAATNT